MRFAFSFLQLLNKDQKHSARVPDVEDLGVADRLRVLVITGVAEVAFVKDLLRVFMPGVNVLDVKLHHKILCQSFT